MTAAGDDGQIDAWLWAEPDDAISELPTITEVETLPLHQLSFRDAERLFLRLLDDMIEVSYAKSYGTVGQKQYGIDVYGRIRHARGQFDTAPDHVNTATSDVPSQGQVREYACLQSKRVQEVSAPDLRDAVTKFLAGPWAALSERFYFATTFDFRSTSLDEAIRTESDRLQAAGVDFIPWDAERVHELLRDRPRLVERFFGRHWVEPFCGGAALGQLAPLKMDAKQARHLRIELRQLYAAVFVAVASLRPAERSDRDAFVVLDALPQPNVSNGTWTEPRTEDGQQIAVAEALNPSDEERAVAGSAMRRPRRSLRSVRSLLDDRRVGDTIGDAVQLDVWLADGHRDLLVGAPGAGKSSLLRFVATDLLAVNPRSVNLQRSHGHRLPVWIPFGFLCHHLDQADHHSLTSAVEAWLGSYSRSDLYPLVAKALDDERLLLLIDGIDEWTSEASAGSAIAQVETFLERTGAAVILTARPYAVARLPLNLTWRRAEIAPLSASQQRTLAAQYLVEGIPSEGPDQTGVKRASTTTWSSANVEPFISQLTSVPDLHALASTPLLLALLARSWQGEPLPNRRFDLYNIIVKMLIDTHPKMRARVSKAADKALNSNDFRTLIQAVAYSIKVDEIPQPVPVRTMRKLIEQALLDDDVFGYEPTEARRTASHALEMAEDEFGILVPQGANHVGFVHRIVGDHLAGCHLAELSPDDQAAVFLRRRGDAGWTDVLLAALNAQPNKHVVAGWIDTILGELDRLEDEEWPYSVIQTQATWRFIAAAVAAGVTLPNPNSQQIFERIINQIEESTSLSYRADLLVELVNAANSNRNWGALQSVFRRWLDATRFSPSAAIRTLERMPERLDPQIRRILLRSLRHDDGSVRSAAADVFALRYGNLRDVTDDDARQALSQPDQDLLSVVDAGPDARTQSAALWALAKGWPGSHLTRERVDWARSSVKANLRTTALVAVAERNPILPLADVLSPSEVEFVRAYLLDERQLAQDHDWTDLNAMLVERLVEEASEDEKSKYAQFAIDTLRQMSATRGNRQLCWRLACGPLKDYAFVRDWVIECLNNPNGHGALILYNLGNMPDKWLAYSSMREALESQAERLLNGIRQTDLRLTRSLSNERSKELLIRSLDKWRPLNAALELVRRFANDQQVIEELDKRFAEDSSAATLAGAALEYMGTVAGFARLYGLLESLNAVHTGTASESHVIVAHSVARSWRIFKQAVREDERIDGVDPSDAAEVLATYSDSNVAAACMAVPTKRGLGWHIAEVIQAWPHETVDYTVAELRSSRHITPGLSDPIHAQALAAHGTIPSPRSAEVLELALDQLEPLPPELREVLVYELASSSVSAGKLLDVADSWRSDPDDEVRRMSAVGISMALLRLEQHARDSSPEYSAWCEEMREMLCAYGYNYEENRQIAWICMLILRLPQLLDNMLETIGDETPPRIRLHDIYGNTDELLIGLIAQNWDALLPHLTVSPLQRLSDSRTKSEGDEDRVVEQLLYGLPLSPSIVEVVKDRIALESEGFEGRTRSLLESTPAGIDYLISVEGRTPENLLRTLRAASQTHLAIGDGRGLRERWAFSRLTERWEMSDTDLESVLRGSMSATSTPTQDGGSQLRNELPVDGSIARAAHDFLYPRSELARARLSGLVAWFASPGEKLDRRPMSWLEAMVLSFLGSPAAELPSLISRVFYPGRLEVLVDPLWNASVPLLRRIITDSSAVQVLADSLVSSVPIVPSPLFGYASSEVVKDAGVAPRVFLVACTLKAAGQLTPERLESAVSGLRGADLRTTVADPFTGMVGPLRSLGTALFDGVS